MYLCSIYAESAYRNHLNCVGFVHCVKGKFVVQDAVEKETKKASFSPFYTTISLTLRRLCSSTSNSPYTQVHFCSHTMLLHARHTAPRRCKKCLNSSMIRLFNVFLYACYFFSFFSVALTFCSSFHPFFFIEKKKSKINFKRLKATIVQIWLLSFFDCVQRWCLS